MSSPYDAVAELYDRAFADIRVRRVEWRWVEQRLQELPKARPRVLEIGCGTGALLRALAPRVERGVGVDVSEGMLTRARAGTGAHENLAFEPIVGSLLPLPDASQDVVISFLSFRYLDWPTIWPEILRVLAPQGRFWMVDMVASGSGLRDLPGLLRAALRQQLNRVTQPQFTRNVRALTRHPKWKAMLAQHPARPLAEYARFFEEVLPQSRLEVLDISRRHRIVAIDSGIPR